MISDTLSDAINQIDDYLSDPTFSDVYTGDLRDRIETLRQQMDTIRKELDAAPTSPEWIKPRDPENEA